MQQRDQAKLNKIQALIDKKANRNKIENEIATEP